MRHAPFSPQERASPQHFSLRQSVHLFEVVISAPHAFGFGAVHVEAQPRTWHVSTLAKASRLDKSSTDDVTHLLRHSSSPEAHARAHDIATAHGSSDPHAESSAQQVCSEHVRQPSLANVEGPHEGASLRSSIPTTVRQLVVSEMAMTTTTAPTPQQARTGLFGRVSYAIVRVS